MSLKKSTKERIKQYILEKIEMGDKAIAQTTADNFEVSLTTVYRYIRELNNDGLIKKKGRNYVLEEMRKIKVYDTNKKLEEDKIFSDIIEKIVKDEQISNDEFNSFMEKFRVFKRKYLM